MGFAGAMWRLPHWMTFAWRRRLNRRRPEGRDRHGTTSCMSSDRWRLQSTVDLEDRARYFLDRIKTAVAVATQMGTRIQPANCMKLATRTGLSVKPPESSPVRMGLRPGTR